MSTTHKFPRLHPEHLSTDARAREWVKTLEHEATEARNFALAADCRRALDRVPWHVAARLEQDAARERVAEAINAQRAQRETWTLEEYIDCMSEWHWAYIGIGIDAYSQALPDDQSVSIEDLTDAALAALIHECECLPDTTTHTAEREGLLIAPRFQFTEDMNLRPGGDPVYQLELCGEPGHCPQCGVYGGLHRAACPVRASVLLEECEDNACDGCPWCDAMGYTMEGLAPAAPVPSGYCPECGVLEDEHRAACPRAPATEATVAPPEAERLDWSDWSDEP